MSLARTHSTCIVLLLVTYTLKFQIVDYKFIIALLIREYTEKEKLFILMMLTAFSRHPYPERAKKRALGSSHPQASSLGQGRRASLRKCPNNLMFDEYE